jgi:hypothetical protein
MSLCLWSRAGGPGDADQNRPELSDHQKRLIFRHMALAEIRHGPLSARRRRHLLRFARRLGIRHGHARFLITQAQYSLDALAPPEVVGRRRPAWTALLPQSVGDWFTFALLAAAVLAVELLLLDWLSD